MNPTKPCSNATDRTHSRLSVCNAHNIQQLSYYIRKNKSFTPHSTQILEIYSQPISWLVMKEQNLTIKASNNFLKIKKHLNTKTKWSTPKTQKMLNLKNKTVHLKLNEQSTVRTAQIRVHITVHNCSAYNTAQTSSDIFPLILQAITINGQTLSTKKERKWSMTTKQW